MFFAYNGNKPSIYGLPTELEMVKGEQVEQKKTGKWLAEQLGKSTCTVSKWCKNSVQPDLNTLNEIANKLHVDIKDL